MTAAPGRAAAGRFAPVLAAALLAATTLAGQQTRPSPGVTGEWHLIVLGIAQDGGIPHLGCEQEICRSIREGRRKPERVASLGLLNTALGKAYLFDATSGMLTTGPGFTKACMSIPVVALNRYAAPAFNAPTSLTRAPTSACPPSDATDAPKRSPIPEKES